MANSGTSAPSRKLLAILLTVLLAVIGYRAWQGARPAPVAPAEAASKAAPAAEPASKAMLIQARQLHGAGRHAEADALVEKVLQDEPQNTRALSARAFSRRSRHDFAGALADYNLILRGNGGDAYAYISRASARLGAGDGPGALADADEYVKRNKDPVYARIRRAELRFAAGQAKPAFDELRAVISETANNPEDLNNLYARYALGHLYFAQGDFRRAEQAFNDTFQRWEKMSVAHNIRLNEAGADHLAWLVVAAARGDRKPPGKALRDNLLQAAKLLPIPQVTPDGGMALLFANTRTPDDFIAEEQKPSDNPMHRSPCTVALLVGEWQMIYGSRDKAREQFRQAREICEPSELNYLTAGNELALLDGKKK